MNFKQLCKKTNIDPDGNFTSLLVALDNQELNTHTHNLVIEEMKVEIAITYADNENLKKHMIEVADCSKK